MRHALNQKKSAATRSARVHTTIEVTVRLSQEQYERFAAGADEYGAEVGDVILALACDELETGQDYGSHMDRFMASLLWRFASCRTAPEIDAQSWGDGAGFYTDAEIAAMQPAKTEVRHG